MQLQRVLVAALGFAGLLPGQEDQLWHARNRGKAFYENPTTQNLAVDEFRKALALAPNSNRERLNYGLALLRAGKIPEGVAELKRVQASDPKLPHTWFNLGIQHKKNGETAEALAAFQRMVQLVPDDAVSHYNLGVLLKLENKLPEALAQFQKAAELNPSLAAPHFQLFNSYRIAGDREKAAKELAIFQDLKKVQEATGNTEDVEWNDYAEVYDPIDPTPIAPDPQPPTVRFTARKLEGALKGGREGSLVLDFDADGKPDLLMWSAGGGLLYRNATTPVKAPLEDGRLFIAGDIDNDGFPELCMITGRGAELLHNRKGVFAKAAKPLASGAFVKAVWIDYDHDYDLDLMLLGPKSVLLRNQGESGFAERTADFPFVSGTPVDALVFRVIPDTKSFDVLVTYADRASVLYRDRLAGKFYVTTIDAVPRGATQLTASDWNHDSTFDLAFASGLAVNQRGVFKTQPAPMKSAFTFADPANLGITEIISGDSIYSISGAARKAEGLRAATTIAAADFNLDGRIDLAMAAADGIFVLTNATVSRNRWFTVRLTGVKNLKRSPYAEVELRAGRFYQKQLYNGHALTFGLRNWTELDTVRITWPNGMIQNEPKQATSRVADYKEAPRLSGSCPMIFTWDGKQFRFLTDVLGVAPLGASAGDGKYFPTDHDEYVFIPGDVLQPRDGFYELRMTEELSEVTYLDQVQLLAVDHPSNTEVFSNDKWKSPPFPEFKLYSTARRILPKRTIAPPFKRTMLNTAEMHNTEVHFDASLPAEGAFLVLNGWVDWADGSTFLKQAQDSGKDLTPPYLQVRDGQGQWRTVIEDMGIPSGKSKTIAVDLSGKFLSASRDIRIVTNMCVYWDQIFAGVDDPKAARRVHRLSAHSADLAFHGFSQPVIHPQRLKPEHFVYEPSSSTSAWNPTSGMYTRFGDVEPLLQRVDDKFVIMGSGDEVRLRFPELPPPPGGWKRDYLLYVDGWAKDADANTAYSQTVEPLPYHGMTQYPYGKGESYPRDPEHDAYRRQYNTRPALRLLRPVAP
jgi:Flp pilus assembly protein TadD